MRCLLPLKLWALFSLGRLSTLFVAVVAVREAPSVAIGPEEACADFADGKMSGSAWSLADCMEVWTQFVETVPSSLWKRLPYTDPLRETAAELRRTGSPCLAAGTARGDGVGSTTIRILSSWLLAKEMGCDWVTPDWGRRHVVEGEESVLYCHRTVAKSQMGALRNQTDAALMEMTRCSVVDWLSFFQFSVPSVSRPEGATIKEVDIGLRSNAKAIRQSAVSLKAGEFAAGGWDRVLFRFDLSYAGRYFLAVGNWDEDRRELVRNMIGEARRNFHVHPRQWYDENPECAFEPAKLNFAIHIRMGDRQGLLGERPGYFHTLELFMDTVSKEVVRRGLQPPLFHVFSETLYPCPPEDTGIFDEFPTWPVHQDPGCLTAEVPKDCPERHMGRPCSPLRSGIFHVVGMPLVLHLGSDVHNALTCMIQADGLLMGCSTFGHVAGVLSQGISFFSMHCSGHHSPVQYKTIPPIAVAERGHLWVPVAGSWHDPVLTSTEVLSGALDIHLGNKGWV